MGKKRRRIGEEFNKHSQETPASTWNMLTGLVLTAALVAAVFILVIFFNPQTSLNPLRPSTPPVMISLPTATATNWELPATWTPSMEPLAITNTPTPEGGVSDPSGPLVPQLDTTATATLDTSSLFPFQLLGQPAPLASTLYHSESGCAWSGIAGYVNDLQGRPITGIQVRLGGTLNGQTISQITLSGTARSYGESGYEFYLGDMPVASTGTLWVQLYDQADLIISDRITINTFNACEQNLILVNFKQVR
ncbi:MAG TPA: hypothetical protein VN376_04180 [Longilinea sp.]|nr:hypothetical protein [Longilinea sp.]